MRRARIKIIDTAHDFLQFLIQLLVLLLKLHLIFRDNSLVLCIRCICCVQKRLLIAQHCYLWNNFLHFIRESLQPP